MQKALSLSTFTRPTAHFKVVVERSHLKHSLAVGELEISHLDYIRQSFDDIHDAECYEYKRHIVKASAAMAPCRETTSRYLP